MSFTRLYLGRLAPDTRREDIEDFFKGYGRINDLRVMNGFGFCEFENARDAEDVQKDFNGRSFMGDRIVVEAAKGAARRREFDSRGPPPGRGGDPYYGGGGGRFGGDRGGYGGARGGFGGERGGYGAARPAPRLRRGNYRVIVTNLPTGTSWQDLKDLGREAGQIAFADVSATRPDEGVLEYQNREDMERAVIKIDGVELRGNKLRVEADARAASPPRRDGGDYRERSPLPARGGRDSRERSPPPRRRDDSPPPRRRDDSPPPRRREDDQDFDRREPPPARRHSASRSPPPARRERSYDDRSPARD